jgi:hypothetical protein
MRVERDTTCFPPSVRLRNLYLRQPLISVVDLDPDPDQFISGTFCLSGSKSGLIIPDADLDPDPR